MAKTKTEDADDDGAKKIGAAADTEAPTTKPAPATPSSSSGVTYDGAQLKKAREAKGLTHEEISSRTKISRKVLSALEDERYEDLPNARVYVRGFVRCIARELGLDPEQVSRTYVPRWEAWPGSRSEP